jgi:hypothetical protein
MKSIMDTILPTSFVPFVAVRVIAEVGLFRTALLVSLRSTMISRRVAIVMLIVPRFEATGVLKAASVTKM